MSNEEVYEKRMRRLIEKAKANPARQKVYIRKVVRLDQQFRAQSKDKTMLEEILEMESDNDHQA